MVTSACSDGRWVSIAADTPVATVQGGRVKHDARVPNHGQSRRLEARYELSTFLLILAAYYAMVYVHLFFISLSRKSQAQFQYARSARARMRTQGTLPF